MQTSDFRNRDDWVEFRRLDWPSVRRVLVEREMSSSAVIVREVRGQDASQMPLAEHDDMLQALASHRADEPLDEGVLPGAVRRREDFTDPHPLDSLPKPLAVDGVAIAQEIGRRGGVREGVDDLLGGPGGGGMLRDVEVKDAAAVVGENDQDEEDAQAGRGHREEVEADEVSDVIGEERSPRLGGRAAPRREQPGDGAFGHRDAELEELGMDSRGTPEGIPCGHAALRQTSALISALTGGRPPEDPPERFVQYSRTRRRCHRRTVSGVTITRDALQPAQTRARPTQKRRSILRSRGRVTGRL